MSLCMWCDNNKSSVHKQLQALRGRQETTWGYYSCGCRYCRCPWAWNVLFEW